MMVTLVTLLGNGGITKPITTGTSSLHLLYTRYLASSRSWRMQYGDKGDRGDRGHRGTQGDTGDNGENSE